MAIAVRIVGATLALGTAVAAAPHVTTDRIQIGQAREPAPVSASAQRVYEGARSRLFQVRTLLAGQETQAGAGSGFLVTDAGHILTNYHVVSHAALEPERFRLVYRTEDREEGALHLLAFDAVHDLALVRPVDPSALAGRAPLRFRSGDTPLVQGDRLYSLGHPLDVGFAVVEGTYNGFVERSFHPTLFFGGSLNPGVSGGPALDGNGLVIGVNVAKRADGEQVSFLVPASFAAALRDAARDAGPMAGPAYPELARQLTAYQASLTERFLALPWRTAGHGAYRVPVPDEEFMRCWGSSSPVNAKGLRFERSDCRMASRVFVSDWLTTGFISVRHEALDGGRLALLRFAYRYSQRFGAEYLGGQATRDHTGPQCHERYVAAGGVPMRAVICLTAYRKLPDLYDLSILVATVDAARSGVQGRFDASGVAFENALALANHYLRGFARADGTGAAP